METVMNFTQAYSVAPWRKQIQVIGLFCLVLVFIALVAGIYLSVTARAATIGREIQSMQRDITTLERDTADLQARLANLSSAGEMERRALSLGFQPVNPEETLYLKVPGYGGRQPVVLATGEVPQVVGAPALPAEYTESLLEWLYKGWLRWNQPAGG